MLELGVRGLCIPAVLLDVADRWACAAVDVDRDAFRDRRHPRPELLAVTQSAVTAESAEERLLKGVFRLLGPEASDEQAIHAVAMLGIELLEGRNSHVRHHLL